MAAIYYSYQCINGECGQLDGVMVDIRTNSKDPGVQACFLCGHEMHFMGTEKADSNGYVPVEGPRWVKELLFRQLKKHPLPWKVDQDWTWEVLDAKDGCVAKFMTCFDAEEFIKAAETLQIYMVESSRAADDQLRQLGYDDLADMLQDKP